MSTYITQGTLIAPFVIFLHIWFLQQSFSLNSLHVNLYHPTILPISLTRSLYVYLYHPWGPALAPLEILYIFVFYDKILDLIVSMSTYIYVYLYHQNILKGTLHCPLYKICTSMTFKVSLSTYIIQIVSLGPYTVLDIAMYSGSHRDPA